MIISKRSGRSKSEESTFCRAITHLPLPQRRRCPAWRMHRGRRRYEPPQPAEWRGAASPSGSESWGTIQKSAWRHPPHLDRASDSPAGSSQGGPQGLGARPRHQSVPRRTRAMTLAAPEWLAGSAEPPDYRRQEEYGSCEKSLRLKSITHGVVRLEAALPPPKSAKVPNSSCA